MFRTVPGVREWAVKDYYVGDKGFGGECRLWSGISPSSWAEISLSVMVVYGSKLTSKVPKVWSRVCIRPRAALDSGLM